MNIWTKRFLVNQVCGVERKKRVFKWRDRRCVQLKTLCYLREQLKHLEHHVPKIKIDSWKYPEGIPSKAWQIIKNRGKYEFLPKPDCQWSRKAASVSIKVKINHEKVLDHDQKGKNRCSKQKLKAQNLTLPLDVTWAKNPSSWRDAENMKRHAEKYPSNFFFFLELQT